ncbi:glycoside hydrolase family 95 protein [Novosphingobium terrae]|uniref:glycoside hydrolase family 95 protein n=1 Tax=Novosphingobium terrae TaxID=2726189 RepID=UPI001F12E144|nr:glycoside hydrolase family 95 protein [Novosphingobium terrae]
MRDKTLSLTRRQAIGGASAALTALHFAPDPGWSATPVHGPNLLWYQAPAKVWTEALPVGNGRLGAMVFGGLGKERIQLNESTLWAGGPYNPVNPAAKAALPHVRQLIFEGRYEEAERLAESDLLGTPKRQCAYQALGNLLLDMPGLEDAQASDYRRDLDLDTAVATTRFTHKGTQYRREVLASFPDQVIAIRLTAQGPGRIDLDCGLGSPQTDATCHAEGHDSIVLSGRNAQSNGIPGVLRFEARLKAITQGGHIATADGRLTMRGANEVVLLVAMATSYQRFDKVDGDPSAITSQQISAATARGFERIARDASADHQTLFRRVAVDFGTSPAAAQPTDARIRLSESSDDPALAALYFQYGRYLLISSSRAGGQAATLQGLWNDSLDPPWGSKYTININTQMNYWPAEPTNLAECVQPLVALVREIAITGAVTAREMYGARGWVTHHNTDLWRATAPIDGARYGMWPMGGAWLCTHLWDHYDYGRDKAYLASVYPLLKGACAFFLDVLVKDPRSGFLVTNPSMSPENNHGHGSSLCAGPSMDMEILRDLFDQTAQAAAILGLDSEFSAQLQATRARLAPSKIGKAGQLQEWQEDWDMDAPEIHHRHVSHLYALFPSHQIDVHKTPDLAAAAARSLDIRGDRATGWATAWRINLWARLGQGDHAHSILRFLLGPERTYPNMFDAHPPFQIDGNFGGASGMTEMLMQSNGDEIRLLPALPKAWPSGSIRGLRARGCCLVDVTWRDGQLDSATIRTTLPGRRRIMAGTASIEIDIAPGHPARLVGPALHQA